MSQSVVRRERLGRFVDLARVYRGWSKQELAANLGRDLSKIVPDSGNPKLDLVMALADALDWNVGDVAKCVWDDPPADGAPGDFAELDARAMDAHRAGNWQALVDGGRALLAAARTPAERARALNRISGGHDGLGRHARSLECLQEALSLAPLPEGMALMLRVNLAGAHHALWHLVEARATARELVERFEARPPEGRLERVAQAFALMYRGQSARRAIGEGGRLDLGAAREARADLERACVLFSRLAREFGDDSYGGVGNTCRGALIEVDCALGATDPRDAVATITEALGGIEDPQLSPPGDWLESWGWWCIYGCNVAMRHLEDPLFHRAMAIFTNKAIDVADRLGNWSLRERAFSLEQVRRERLERSTGFDAEWVLDEEDVRTIAGTMGRFPAFRETGWRILADARIVEAQ
jgi:transcriptional regulator with XRE-family HTH domain